MLPMVSLIKLIKSLSLFILSVYNLYQLINDYIYIEPAAIEEESNDELLLEIALKYDADGRRPSEGGVKITIPNNQERYSFNSDQIIQIVPLLIDNTITGGSPESFTKTHQFPFKILQV